MDLNSNNFNWNIENSSIGGCIRRNIYIVQVVHVSVSMNVIKKSPQYFYII